MIPALLPLVGPFGQHSQTLVAGDHLAHFYSKTNSLYPLVCEFFTPAFSHQQAMIIIARPQTRETLRNLFQQKVCDVDGAMARGQLVMLDAETVLSTFIKDGRPDPEAFEQTVGEKIRFTHEKFPFIRAYGEMVDVLWQQGNPKASLSLERLWGKLSQRYKFSLFCGYNLSEEGKHGTSFNGVCCSHTHVVTSDGNLRIVSAA